MTRLLRLQRLFAVLSSASVTCMWPRAAARQSEKQPRWRGSASASRCGAAEPHRSLLWRGSSCTTRAPSCTACCSGGALKPPYTHTTILSCQSSSLMRLLPNLCLIGPFPFTSFLSKEQLKQVPRIDRYIDRGDFSRDPGHSRC